MECQDCHKNKLSREFPRMEHSTKCDHPQTCCLRCTMERRRAGQTKCPYPECPNDADEGFFSHCEEELDYLFPSLPNPTEVVLPAYSSSEASAEVHEIIIATLLSGEHCSIPYDPRKPILQLKNEVESKLGVPASKQKLFYGETELSHFTQANHGTATLGYYNIKPRTSIQVHVQLLEIPTGLRQVIFDLQWGYPRGVRRRDYLDVAAFCYNGRKEIAYSDFRRSRQVCLEGAITHSGGLMDDSARTGRHRIIVNFDVLPPEINSIFFTVSAWRAPNMSLYRTPTLLFYDPARPDQQLCENYVREAPPSKSMVMCVVKRKARGWVVFGIGKESDGNAANYRPIRYTLKELARQRY